MKEGNRVILNGDSVSLQVIAVKGWNVATNDELRAEDCEAGVRERGEVRVRKRFQEKG